MRVELMLKITMLGRGRAGLLLSISSHLPSVPGCRCAPHPTGCLTSIFPSGTCVHPVVQQIPFPYFYMPSSTYYISSRPAHSPSETLPNSVLSPSSCPSQCPLSCELWQQLPIWPPLPLLHSHGLPSTQHSRQVTLPKHTSNSVSSLLRTL